MTTEELRRVPPILDSSGVVDEIATLTKDIESTGKIVLPRGGFPPRVLPAIDRKGL